LKDFAIDCKSVGFEGILYFEAGCYEKNVDELIGKSGPTIIITSRSHFARGTLNVLTEYLGKDCVEIIDTVESHPTLDQIEIIKSRLNGLNYSRIIGLGGGSVIDTCKILKFLLIKKPDITFEKSPKSPLKFIAIPTTSGTGSEVTPFATFWNFENRTKESFVREDLKPDTVVLDPTLTYSLPLDTTISSGLDAVSHAFDSIWNKNATEVTKDIAERSLELSLPAIKNLNHNLQDWDSRSRMMESSLLAGFAISKTRTSISHSISYPITSHLNISHGIACAISLPFLAKFTFSEFPEIFRNLNFRLGLRSNSDLYESVLEVLVDLQITQTIRNSCRSSRDLRELIPHMLDMKRSSNFLVSLDHKILEEKIFNPMVDFIYS
jgi:alcohol dehydrogenase